MLVTADRSFYSFDVWQEFRHDAHQGAALDSREA